MKVLRSLFFASLTVLIPPGLHAADYYVAQGGQTPVSGYTGWATAASNIQDAVDAASEGDTVWIAPGTYAAPASPTNYAGSDHVVFLNQKLVTLRSSNGVPATTIIDGEGANRGIAIRRTAAGSAPFVLDGITVRNGYGADTGGGILGNTGGNYPWTCILRNSVIISNTVHGTGNPYGGGFGNNCSSAAFQLSISNCVFRGNVSTNTAVARNSLGGAIYNRSSADTRIIDSTIERNMSMETGGGILAYQLSTSSLIVSNCIFRNNEALYYENAVSGGGAIQVSGGGMSAYNSLFYKNRAGGIARGGAINSQSSSAGMMIELVSCTIASNTSAHGAVYTRQASGPYLHMVNSVVQDNQTSGGTEQNLYLANVTTGTNRASFSCFYPTNISNLVSAEGNTETNPFFIDLGAGNVQLWPWSPAAVDMGTNQPWMASATDLAGSPRISANGRVDMGCYETGFQDVPDHYVAHDGQTPQHPYTNWVTAASNIQEAADAVWENAYFFGHTVWVGDGRYTAPPNATNYAGTNVLYLSAPVIVQSASGDPADVVIDGEGRHRGIAVVYDELATIVIDGLTVSNCFARTAGGGIMMHDPVSGYLSAGWTGVVRNCIIRDNVVTNGPAVGYWPEDARGGGIGILTRSEGTFVISNTLIQGNLAIHSNLVSGSNGGDGGGLYAFVYYGSNHVMDCAFHGNTAYRGANAYVGAASMWSVFENCVVADGVVYPRVGTQYFAGGVFIDQSANMVFRGCLMMGNEQGSGRGGAINNEARGSNRVFRIESCTIVDNDQGVYLRGWAQALGAFPALQVYNSIVTSNAAAGTANFALAAPTTGYTHTVDYSCYVNPDPDLTIGAGNLTVDPGFESYAVGNYRISPFSPCVNAGLNQAWMAGTLDLAGNPRLDSTSEQVDMGAYEVQLRGAMLIVW